MARYMPYGYEQINIQAGTNSPSTVKAYNNKTFAFWERALFQRACSVLSFELPKEWQGPVKDFFYYSLFRFGFVAVFDDNYFGYSFQPCTLNGHGFYYQPTSVLISNPLYTERHPVNNELIIGKDCELLKLTPDYMGTYDIIEKYAEQLSTLDNAINMSIINSKFALIFAAKNKGAAAMVKKMLDKINRGDPAIIFDSSISDNKTDGSMPWHLIERDLQKTYITPNQLQDMQTILNNFDTEVGIPTIPYAKKERMVTKEAESRQIDATARATTWMESLQSSAEVVNKHFSDKDPIIPSLRFNIEEEGDEEDEFSEVNPDRT